MSIANSTTTSKAKGGWTLSADCVIRLLLAFVLAFGICVPTTGTTSQAYAAGESHAITIAAGNSTSDITISPTSAKAGETVTITATGSSYFAYDIVSDGGTTEVTATDGKATFTMPDSDVSIDCVYNTPFKLYMKYGDSKETLVSTLNYRDINTLSETRPAGEVSNNYWTGSYQTTGGGRVYTVVSLRWITLAKIYDALGLTPDSADVCAWNSSYESQATYSTLVAMPHYSYPNIASSYQNNQYSAEGAFEVPTALSLVSKNGNLRLNNYDGDTVDEQYLAGVKDWASDTSLSAWDPCYGITEAVAQGAGSTQVFTYNNNTAGMESPGTLGWSYNGASSLTIYPSASAPSSCTIEYKWANIHSDSSLNGPSTVSLPESVTNAFGGSYTIPTGPTVDGKVLAVGDTVNADGYKYTWQGWDQSGSITTAAEKITIRGTWSVEKLPGYTINYHIASADADAYGVPTDAASVDAASGEVGSATTLALPSTTWKTIDGTSAGSAGKWTFSGWYADEACTGDAITQAGATATAGQTIDVYGKWTFAASHKITLAEGNVESDITFSVNGNIVTTSGDEDTITAAAGDTVTVSTGNNSYYKAFRISGDDGSSIDVIGASGTFTMPDCSVTVDVVYNTAFNLYVSYDGGTTKTLAKVVNYGDISEYSSVGENYWTLGWSTARNGRVQAGIAKRWITLNNMYALLQRQPDNSDVILWAGSSASVSPTYEALSQRMFSYPHLASYKLGGTLNLDEAIEAPTAIGLIASTSNFNIESSDTVDSVDQSVANAISERIGELNVAPWNPLIASSQSYAEGGFTYDASDPLKCSAGNLGWSGNGESYNSLVFCISGDKPTNCSVEYSWSKIHSDASEDAPEGAVLPTTASVDFGSDYTIPTTVTVGDKTLNVGDSVIVGKTKYTWKGWDQSGTIKASAEKIQIAGLWDTEEMPAYTVNYSVAGDATYGVPTDATVAAGEFAVGTSATLASAATTAWKTSDGTTSGKVGTWTFSGWYANEDCTGDTISSYTPDDTVVAGSTVNVYGKWTFTAAKTITLAEGNSTADIVIKVNGAVSTNAYAKDEVEIYAGTDSRYAYFVLTYDDGTTVELKGPDATFTMPNDNVTIDVVYNAPLNLYVSYDGGTTTTLAKVVNWRDINENSVVGKGWWSQGYQPYGGGRAQMCYALRWITLDKTYELLGLSPQSNDQIRFNGSAGSVSPTYDTLSHPRYSYPHVVSSVKNATANLEGAIQMPTSIALIGAQTNVRISEGEGDTDDEKIMSGLESRWANANLGPWSALIATTQEAAQNCFSYSSSDPYLASAGNLGWWTSGAQKIVYCIDGDAPTSCTIEYSWSKVHADNNAPEGAVLPTTASVGFGSDYTIPTTVQVGSKMLSVGDSVIVGKTKYTWKGWDQSGSIKASAEKIQIAGLWDTEEVTGTYTVNYSLSAADSTVGMPSDATLNADTFAVGDAAKLSTPTTAWTTVDGTDKGQLGKWTFDGWYTDEKCTGEAVSTYEAGKTASDGESVTLYGKWSFVPATYKVSYSITSADPSSYIAPTDASTLIDTVEKVGSATKLATPTTTWTTIFGTEASQAGTWTFSGWYADASCTGTPITSVGDAAKEGDTITVYGKWAFSADCYTLAYNASAADSSYTVPADATMAKVTASAGSAVTLQTPTTEWTTIDGTATGQKGTWTFDGWYANAACTGDKLVSVGADAKKGDTVNVYGKWSFAPATYKVNYIMTSADSSAYAVPTDAVNPTSATTKVGSATQLSAAPKTLWTTIDGKAASQAGTWAFSGWYTDATCTGSAVTSVGNTAQSGDTINVYGKWTFVASTYKVNYSISSADASYKVPTDAASVESATTKVGSATILAALPTTSWTTIDGKSGSQSGTWTFSGWYTNAACTGTPVISAGASAKSAETVTVYGKWTFVADTYKVNYSIFSGDAVAYSVPTDAASVASVTAKVGSATTLASAPTTSWTTIDGKASGQAGKWTFSGWYADPSCTGSALTSVGAKAQKGDSITVYGKWTFVADTYKVSYSISAADSSYKVPTDAASVEGVTTKVGAATTLAVTPATSWTTIDGTATGQAGKWTFAGWYDNAACTGNPVKTVGANAKNGDNITVYGKWTFVADTYKVSYSISAADSSYKVPTDAASVEGVTAKVGAATTLAVIPATSWTTIDGTATGQAGKWTFSGWYADADCSGDVVTSVGENAKDGDNITVYGKWMFVPETYTLNSFAGSTRFNTSSRIAKAELAAGNYKGIIVATGAGQKFADSLAAAGLSGVLNYPVIMVDGEQSMLDSDALATVRAMAQNGDLDIIIVGGTSAVSAGIETQLNLVDSDGAVMRLAGTDRYDTDMKVYEYGKDHGGWNTQYAVVATGNNFPDALAAASFCAAMKAPLFMVDSTASGISSEVSEAILKGGFDEVVILGGENSVTAAQYSQIVKAQGDKDKVNRFGGNSRYDTMLKFVSWELEHGMTLEGAGFATGANFPDALTSASLLAQSNSVMCLVSPNDADNKALYDLLSEKGTDVHNINVFGGTSAVSDTARTDILTALGNEWQTKEW